VIAHIIVAEIRRQERATRRNPMIRDNDPNTFAQACLDTRVGGLDPKRVAEAHRRNDPDVLLDCPGTCLKSIERDASMGGFPRFHGILVTYDAPNDFVLVRGHGSPVSPTCVWTGTVAEYRGMWQVD
jgi:hypothetical protein